MEMKEPAFGKIARTARKPALPRTMPGCGVGRSAWLFGTAFAVCGVALVQMASANLVEDGSFDGFDGGKFFQWEIGPKPDVGGATAIGMISQDGDGGFPKGGNAAKFEFSGPGTFTATALGSDGQMLPVEPGQKYRLVVYARSTGGPVSVRAEIRPRAQGQQNRTRTISLKFDPAADWQEHSVEWKAADNETAVNLVFYLENRSPAPTSVWLDEISIQTE